MCKSRLLCVVVLLAGVWLPGSASAETLQLIDYYDNDANPSFAGSQTIWTLDVPINCQTDCQITLTAQFIDPSGSAVNAYTGTYLDSVQWVVSQPDVDPTSVDLTGFTAPAVAPGTDPDTLWSFALDQNLSANQCGGGANDAVCGEWILGGATSAGYGPIQNGSTLTWQFDVDFATGAGLTEDLVSGNIRAAFNKINPQGKINNYNIFSPGGGLFTDDGGSGDDGGGESGVAPEPVGLALWGVGLIAVALRLRRRRV